MRNKPYNKDGNIKLVSEGSFHNFYIHNGTAVVESAGAPVLKEVTNKQINTLEKKRNSITSLKNDSCNNIIRYSSEDKNSNNYIVTKL
jgi:hypothetical protein